MLVPITLFRISYDMEGIWIGGTLFEAACKLVAEENWRLWRVSEITDTSISLEWLEIWHTKETICDCWAKYASTQCFRWSVFTVHVQQDSEQLYGGNKLDERFIRDMRRKLDNICDAARDAQLSFFSAL